MIRRWQPVVLALGAGLFAVSIVAAWQVLPFTPHGAARVNSRCPPLLPHRRLTTVTRDTLRGTVVFMSAECWRSQRRYLGEWRAIYQRPIWRGQEGGLESARPAPPGAFVQYAAAGHLTAGQAEAFIYGRGLTRRVAAVEVRFDNGLVQRDSLARGMFALVGAGAEGACELRVLDASGQMLQRINLASPAPVPPLGPRDANWGGNRASSATCAPRP